MTPAEEAEFIQLWQQQVSYQELAAALGIPMGTVSSRATRLQQQSKIQPRPRGGAYRKQKAQGRSGVEGGASTVHRLLSTLNRPPWTLYRLPSTLFRLTSPPP